MDSGWHRADIKAAVEKAGTNLTALARDSGLIETACLHAIKARHRPGEHAIAALIKVPLWELWPDRWAKPATPDGEAIRLDGRRKLTPEAA